MVPTGFCALNTHVSLFGLFDVSTVPPFLYYTYVPILLFSVWYALFFLWGDRKSPRSILFTSFFGFLTLWMGLYMLTWMSVQHSLIYVSYALLPVIESLVYAIGLLFLLSLYQDNRARISFRTFGFVFLVPLLLVLLTPTTANIVGYYDTATCDLVRGGGLVWRIVYLFEFAVSFVALWITTRYTLNTRNQKSSDRESPVIGIGFALFFVLFLLSGVFVAVTGNHQFDQFRAVGIACIWICVLSRARSSTFLSTHISHTQLTVSILWMLVVGFLFVRNAELLVSVVRASIVPLTLLGVVAFFSSDSERRARDRLEDLTIVLNQRNDELARLNNLKTEFLSFATHQLKSPLTSLRWAIETLRESKTSTFSQVDITSIEHMSITINQMVRTVTDFLNVSRFEQGVLTLNIAPTDMSAVVQRVVDEYTPLAVSRSLRLIARVPIGISLYADETRIEQVCANLVDNAIKYTPSGEVIITLIERDTTLRIEVSDTGMGVAPSEAEQIFHKFARGDAGKLNTMGSGIGLYMVREIIEMHGGVVGVSSPGRGHGSVFWIEIPRHQLLQSTQSVIERV